MPEIHLEVGEPKIRQFERQGQIAAVAELIWNALDANATEVRVELKRTVLNAVDAIAVIDNGEGITPEQAAESFREYGDTWKAKRTHTSGNKRILHGKKGEGRLYALALGETFVWDTVAMVGDRNLRTRIHGSRAKPTLWRIDEPVETEDPPCCTVTIAVPQGKRLKSLESAEAAANLTAKLAFYLRAYSHVAVIFDDTPLDASDVVLSVVDVPLDLPPEYAADPRPPVLTIVEWKSKVGDQQLLVCNADGIALLEYGEEWNDPILSFTPYLRWHKFGELMLEDLHMLPMQHAGLLHAAEQAIRRHLARRREEISAQVVTQLKAEGIYPYDPEDTNPTSVVERQTFDLVVTVARTALPPKGPPRALSVNLIRSALERDPTDLHDILGSVLALSTEEREHLARLIAQTELSSIISAATTVVDRLKFVGGLRKILADRALRLAFREVDQLHPMISQNLWLFGEEWTLARTELSLTGVLTEHLRLLGDSVVLESKLDTVKQADGRTGRVDIVMYRGIGDERQNERLVVELKRPSVRVGNDELQQIKRYARAIVDDPQYRGVACRWKFVLVTYDHDPAIKRDIEQKDKPVGLADDQNEYQVWVHTWGNIFDAAERKLSSFRKQLEYEATDERVTQYLRDSYQKYIPDALLVPNLSEVEDTSE